MPRNHRPARIRPTTLEGRLRCKELRRLIRNPRTSRSDRDAYTRELDTLSPLVTTPAHIERRIHFLRRKLAAGGLTPGRRAGLEAELAMRTAAPVPVSTETPQ
jgi:hypothetical protein